MDDGWVGGVEMWIEVVAEYGMEIVEIREHLTPRPLTLLSLSLRIQSLSLQALSLREFLSKQCTRISKLV